MAVLYGQQKLVFLHSLEHYLENVAQEPQNTATAESYKVCGADTLITLPIATSA